MVEKRPFPGDHGAPNGVKRPKPEANVDIAAKVAEARAKAAAIMAARNEAKAKAAAITKGAPASAAPLSNLEAMKARVAAMQAGKASTPAPLVRPSAQTPSHDEGRTTPHDSRTPRFATTLGNRRTGTDSPLPAAGLQTAAPKQEDEVSENPYLDLKAPVTRPRVTRQLLFNQRGRYLEQAAKLRRQTKLEEIKALLAARNRKAKLDENSERGFLVQQPPDVEWWDEGLLEDKTYDCLDDPQKVRISGDDTIITAYVQHPVKPKAPQDQLLIPVKPMYLTPKERAKLRRQRRSEHTKEIQAKRRLGLLPVEEPKVKRANIMRVMGEQAIQDPTSVEMYVEKQIQKREDLHMATNKERMLTKEERRAKLAENQTNDARKGLQISVFKIDSLAYGKLRYQIDQNAKQHSLTGITIFNPNMNLVIVEGGTHSVQKYSKLLLHRIKWTENAHPTEQQVEKQVKDPEWMKSYNEDGTLKDFKTNKCLKVFEGEVKTRAFRKWGSKTCETDGEAKDILARNKLDSLWALAKAVTE